MLTAMVAVAFESPLVMALVSGVIGAIAGMITVTVQASIYVELRDVKEGVAPADLEAIFA
jgi:hypothetical protein